MIYDKIINASNYQFSDDANGQKINRALSLIQLIDINKISAGMTEIMDGIFLVKKDFESNYEEKFGEIHQRTVDIHLYGGDCNEIIYFDNDTKVTKENTLDSFLDKDVAFVKVDEYQNSVILKDGYFALFLPKEFHAPKIADSNLSKINKIIVKIKLD
ncbi:DUF386 family protein [Mycoplasma sp. NEAQ87857]|uniref:YhcH/YjgK/YiaL family protein n=1 Tax=Mycoplasma sp. NEAQ87857 TaxID=2683967 RepID=UPI00131747B3|nr:YhcH/YjgK/YiaL family protein [Mycoplasma sp. NEAQ87857]QGZ97605.1 DUF386 family protein [Mycoplasma sp. NEAQ87857]